MNKKIVFFLLCNLHFIIYASEKTIASLAISTLGNTITKIFKPNDQENTSSNQFQNDASCSCCCCCSFKSVTSWFYKTCEETSSNHDDLSTYHEQKPVKSTQDTEMK